MNLWLSVAAIVALVVMLVVITILFVAYRRVERRLLDLEFEQEIHYQLAIGKISADQARAALGLTDPSAPRPPAVPPRPRVPRTGREW